MLLLFKGNKALKGTIMTFLVTIPSLVNIGSLLLLVIFIYSVLGVYLFAEVKHNGELNYHANFTSIGAAFLTLIRAMTGEKWPMIMNALSRKLDLDYNCIENPSYQDYILNNSKFLL